MQFGTDIMMAEVIFWIAFTGVLYVYCGYPLLLTVWRQVAPKPIQKGRWEPFVSVVVAACNERERIGAKMLNCLALDYPVDKREIIVSLDGSSDGTEEAACEYAREYAARGITVIAWPTHEGKAAAVNRAVAASRGEVIVFADARQWIAPSAVRELVANFHNPSVGAVSGELILHDESQSGEASDATGLYWRYEKWIRAMESDVNSVVGATGALYAMRRELFVPLPKKTVLDDVWLPMRSVLLGKRVVFEPAAKAYDIVAQPEIEYERKVRTLYGNYQLLERMPELLLPWRNPIWLQFVSHKVGRLLVPYGLVALFIANCFLLQGFYAATFVLQTAWYVLAVAGGLSLRHQGTSRISGRVRSGTSLEEVR